MKKLLLSVAALCAALGAAAAPPAEDPVLMTVDGLDVRAGEFEYLFKKNNSQQMQPQTVGEYVDMFVDYKLKVADARRAGIDTTATFLAEFNKFRNELAAPYLRDQTVEDKLVKEAYSHLCKDVKVSHIMLAVDRRAGNDLAVSAELNRIRREILKGDITFEEAAKKYSVDRPTAQNGGEMGWISAGRYPWPFEQAAYDTPKGGLSKIIDSGFGYHLIRVEDERPSKGEVHASHILKLTRDVPKEELPAQKAAIDSIYEVVAAGADFADVATRESQDPGSARRGGDLGWFGSGMMVAEFDSVAFALADGEISKPFTTAFGYHIIKRHGHRGVEPLEDAKMKIMQWMSRDERADEPRRARYKQLADKYGILEMKANQMALKQKLIDKGLVCDSAALAALAADQTPLVRIGDQDLVSVAQAYAALDGREFRSAAETATAIIDKAREMTDDIIRDRAVSELETDNADYSNLVNEYRDGIMLFEISNRNVWDRASKDKEGLENYFRKNKSKYAWDKPRFKSYVLFAASDSLLDVAAAYADSLSTDDPETFVADMRKHFGKSIKIERVIAAQGENAITDYLAFGGEKPEAKNRRWSAYRAYKGRLLDQPEEAADVRGAATTDYQALLEKEWVKSLHKKYKVKINKKVLKQLESE